MANYLVFAAAPKLSKDPVSKETLAMTGAVTDMIFSLTGIAPVVFHFTELANTPSNDFRTLAIMDETVRLCGYLASICSDFAKLDKEPVSKLVIAAVGSALALTDSGIQIAEGFII
jgi:hypothetical protein